MMHDLAKVHVVEYSEYYLLLNISRKTTSVLRQRAGQHRDQQQQPQKVDTGKARLIKRVAGG